MVTKIKETTVRQMLALIAIVKKSNFDRFVSVMLIGLNPMQKWRIHKKINWRQIFIEKNRQRYQSDMKCKDGCLET